jgi:anti-sigma regulatory factor (Ser/Thr protein kinase)
MLRDAPTATANLREAVEVVSERYGLAGEERFDLKLAATEALTNALKGTPETQAVEVTLAGEDGAVTVEVLDRGVFSPLRAALAPGPEAEGGRGIALMLALLDDLAFEQTPRARVCGSPSAARPRQRLCASRASGSGSRSG